ncbi:hypothetical protein KC19_VG124000 [Ceratodon purpureus]|uniref:Uncharacterized protein n=1 Tax=Ceratodon purpureus TaxID=3225 RepID=A0A8T0HPL1_CERPU|nr:hypothetical protein KC19_VG124000 [Ceratodon purpureus]
MATYRAHLGGKEMPFRTSSPKSRNVNSEHSASQRLQPQGSAANQTRFPPYRLLCMDGLETPKVQHIWTVVIIPRRKKSRTENLPMEKTTAKAMIYPQDCKATALTHHEVCTTETNGTPALCRLVQVLP